jgi:hypothetical protein
MGETGMNELEQNQNSRAQVNSLQCGFYFHPKDKDLSLGTRLREKPLGGRAVGYSYSGSARGKALLGLGLLLALIGALVLLAARIGLPLGRLPGDISYKGKNFSVYVPLGTSLLISIVMSVILYLFSRFRR